VTERRKHGDLGDVPQTHHGVANAALAGTPGGSGGASLSSRHLLLPLSRRCNVRSRTASVARNSQ
jgi:hypothetical protein